MTNYQIVNGIEWAGVVMISFLNGTFFNFLGRIGVLLFIIIVTQGVEEFSLFFRIFVTILLIIYIFQIEPKQDKGDRK